MTKVLVTIHHRVGDYDLNGNPQNRHQTRCATTVLGYVWGGNEAKAICCIGNRLKAISLEDIEVVSQ